MSVDPMDEFLKPLGDFSRKPLREQLYTLVKASRGSAPPDMPWLSQAMAEGLMMRILVESSHRLERLTQWLVWLTIVLAVLTCVLAYDVARRLIGN